MEKIFTASRRKTGLLWGKTSFCSLKFGDERFFERKAKNPPSQRIGPRSKQQSAKQKFVEMHGVSVVAFSGHLRLLPPIHNFLAGLLQPLHLLLLEQHLQKSGPIIISVPGMLFTGREKSGHSSDHDTRINRAI